MVTYNSSRSILILKRKIMSIVEAPKKLKNVIAVVRVMDPKTEKVEFKITRAIDDSERRDWLFCVQS